ncbi:uncharacterized protein UHOD_05655 [Ustilago sp. UG-2017b]|nr:uncharacterized protein UHOD_05655 [Ustilago sp. UG-2017b]
MSSLQADLSPPPTSGPSSFAPRSLHASKPPSQPARSLSLRIPEEGQAFAALTQPSLPSALPSTSLAYAPAAPPIALNLPSPHQPAPSTLAPPPQSRLARKRPSRLNLAPPSLSDESSLSSRSMPNSPAALSRSSSKAEQLDDSAPPPSAISEAVKNLSSTLRGTPRRRPSMPFKNTAVPETSYPEPPSAASSHTRPPEAFRDPSEHILSGKGSTLQHARSVYSQGPVEILPGLFLGDEHNARDQDMFSALGITTILNVAKETILDFQSPGSAQPNQSHSAWTSASNRNHSSDTSIVGRSRPQHNAVYGSRMISDVPPTPNTYFTPPTTASLPTGTAHGDASSLRDAISTSVLRNTSSTPNLLTHFLNHATAEAHNSHHAATESDLRTLTAQDVLRYRSLRRSSNSSSDDAFDTASSPTSSRAASTCTSAATELTPPALVSLKPRGDAAPETQGHSTSSEYASQQHSPSYAFDDDSQRSPPTWVTQVELPSNATVIKVTSNNEQRLSRELRYIKLPWTHDETELATAHGGFAQGCALIAEALGIDPRYWYAAKITEDRDACMALEDDASLDNVQTSPSPGKILVHCQCGVSRSATLVIAFVMQAAAMRYGFETARTLLGMHDCYNMVKDKSASISPNISLIYQLVEWERHLSSAAGRLRDVLGMGCGGSEGEPGSHSDPSGGQNGVPGAGWSTESMDEAMWSKMRLEEEEKEAAEEARRREERLNEAIRLAAERKAAQDRLEGRTPDAAVGSDVGGGSLMQRRRKKAAPALQLQTAGSSAATSTAPAAAPIPSPGLNKRRPPALQLNSALSGKSHLKVETPFRTARMEAWSEQEHDGDGDVMMSELEPPQTPLRSSAADWDIVSTPTARTTMGAYGSDPASSTLRTPSASTTWHDRARPSSASSHLPASLDTSATHRSSTDGVMATTWLSPCSPAMSTSLSLGSRPSRFSLGGAAPLSGSLTARLEDELEPGSRSKARPDSMQSTMSSSSSTALFGVTALSREERKKQHRRTFSSDWPTLQANLSQRSKSKVEAMLPPNPHTEGAVPSSGYANDAMDV